MKCESRMGITEESWCQEPDLSCTGRKCNDLSVGGTFVGEVAKLNTVPNVRKARQACNAN